MIATPWTSFSELYEATGESPEAIAWLANRGQFARHYRLRWIPKRHGRRLLEAPLPRLKRVQRILLARVLEPQAPHPAATAFRRGASPLDHARRHAGQRWVVRLDLASFFASIGSRRVAGLFRTLGYPRELAAVLADLSTHAARLPEPCSREERLLYQRRHLPQGAPTSPAIANLIARPLDKRLAALARRIGGRYSRYADDLVISCDRFVPWLVPMMGAIAIDEGFEVQFRKTRVMGTGTRQVITGLVVNDGRPRLPRPARKRLEAILHNSVRHGPRSQDRHGHAERFRDHLLGQLAYARHVDPRRAAPLEALFAQIRWDDG